MIRNSIKKIGLDHLPPVSSASLFLLVTALFSFHNHYVAQYYIYYPHWLVRAFSLLIKILVWLIPWNLRMELIIQLPFFFWCLFQLHSNSESYLIFLFLCAILLIDFFPICLSFLKNIQSLVFSQIGLCRYSLLTLASEAICHLIYPFRWQVCLKSACSLFGFFDAALPLIIYERPVEFPLVLLLLIECCSQ